MFKRLVLFTIFMYENDYFHGDIKPMNIVLVLDKEEQNQLDLKIIDFGGATKNWNF